LTDAIAAIGARVPLAGAGIASYAPEYDTDGRVCRAAFAAIDAILFSAALTGRTGLQPARFPS
jgi:hypothetical protein